MILRTLRTASTAGEDDQKYDVSDIHLDSEREGKDPIYDTCDCIGLTIDTHLRESNITPAAFLREIEKMLPGL